MERARRHSHSRITLTSLRLGASRDSWEESEMGQKTNFLQHVSGIAKRDFAKWAREHIITSVVALVSAALGVPGAMLIGNNSLWSEIVALASYSVWGPLALLLVGYAFFFFRAVGKAYGERTAELKRLRIQLGIPTDDLDPPPKKTAKHSSKRWFLYFVACLVTLILALYVEQEASHQVNQVSTNLKKQDARISSVETKCKASSDFCHYAKTKVDECLATSKKAEIALRGCLSELAATQHSRSPQDIGRKTQP